MAPKKATAVKKSSKSEETPVFDVKAVVQDLRETAQRLESIAASLAEGVGTTTSDVKAVDSKQQAAHDKLKADLEKKTLRALKTLGTKEDGPYQFEDDDVADASKDDIIKNMLMVQYPDMYPEDAADDEDEDGDSEDDTDDDDDEEDDEDVSRDDLMKLELKDLKKMAVTNGLYEKLADMKGMDRDTLVDEIMAGGESDDEDDSEDEEEYYTREDYEEMSLKKLKEIADEAGVEYKKGVKQDELIELLLEEDDE